MEQLHKLEVELHQFQTRSNQSRLEELVHDTFFEIGYSGDCYNKQEIISSLSTEDKPTFEVWTQDFQYAELSKGLVHIIYKTARLNLEGNLTRRAIRTSIWKKADNGWQIIFHQATPIENFAKHP